MEQEHELFVWNLHFVPDETMQWDSLYMCTNKDSFVPGANGNNQPYIITIHFHPQRRTSAFRAIGYVLGVTRAIHREVPQLMRLHLDPTTQLHRLQMDFQRNILLDPAVAQLLLHEHQEKCQFDTVGTMVDCSRNGVLNVDSAKFLCRTLALMGFNMLQLYTEDTYEIEDEPFFGYLRGKYSEEELREIDDYAFSFGIEVIPCIQTLGHLGQVLQWPQYVSMRDTSEVLLAESEQTYEMLDKMITHITRPFRSKRIHLGMDEAHGIGYGRYSVIFGNQNHKDPNQIFVEHLQRVNDICLRKGLKPMIWSDMLFSLSRNAPYWTHDGQSTSEHAMPATGIPNNMDLVYWDYYHVVEMSYQERIAIHYHLRSKSPWVASGSWTWSRFWTALPFTFLTVKANLNACKSDASRVRNVFLTVWGDEGNEVDLYSSLPSLQYYADLSYTNQSEVNPLLLKTRLSGITGASFDDYVAATKLDELLPVRQVLNDRIHFAPNTSKWMLWEEPMLGFVTPTIFALEIDAEQHYTRLAEELKSRISKSLKPVSSGTKDTQSDYPLNARLTLPYLVAKTLSLKCGLRHRLHTAYKQHDWEEFRRLSSQIDELRSTINSLWNYHRKLWMSMYKPFGWETLELRYGGLLARVTTVSSRVNRLLRHIDAGGQLGVPLRRHPNPCGEVPGVLLDACGILPIAPSKNCQETTNASEELVPTSEVFYDPASAHNFDDEEVTEIPELAADLEIVFSSADQLLDYQRVSRPTYC